MKVELVQHTPDPVGLIAMAARCCYSDDPRKETKKTPEELVRFILEGHHESPVEHVTYTFYIQGISRACSHQLVRHRLSSVSQRSQRYVSEDNFSYVIPPKLEGKSVCHDGLQTSATEFFKETMRIIGERYRILQEALGGAKESSNEDARYVLPNACTTDLMLSMNIRSLLHLFQERQCSRAQWEIRELANKMLELVYPTAPVVFEHAGPKCKYLGYCPEHKSCGISPKRNS